MVAGDTRQCAGIRLASARLSPQHTGSMILLGDAVSSSKISILVWVPECDGNHFIGLPARDMSVCKPYGVGPNSR